MFARPAARRRCRPVLYLAHAVLLRAYARSSALARVIWSQTSFLRVVPRRWGKVVSRRTLKASRRTAPAGGSCTRSGRGIRPPVPSQRMFAPVAPVRYFVAFRALVVDDSG